MENQKHVIVISIDGMSNHYLNNESVRMPHLRRLIDSGVVAEGMKSIYPTMTWAIHTSLLTGTYPRKHGVIGNWAWDRQQERCLSYAGEVDIDKEKTLHQPTIYDAAKQKGWSTASICFPATKGATTIDYNIPEFYNQSLFEQYSTPSLWQELKEDGLPVDKYATWSLVHATGPLQDWLTTEIGKHLIVKHRPNLLQLHFLLPDSYQHDYGVKSEELYWSLEYVDERIGSLLATLEKEGMADSTDIFVVSDHGFMNYDRIFVLNECFKRQGWFGDSLKDSKVFAISQGGSCFVYVNETGHARMELLEEVREVLNGHEAIESIYDKDQHPELGLPGAGELEHIAPDLVLEAKEGWIFAIHPVQLEAFEEHGHSGMKQDDFGMGGMQEVAIHGKSGMHGYLPSKGVMKAVFVASGPSIRQGIVIPEVNAVDIAPTIARIIGADWSHADGQALDHIWREEVRGEFKLHAEADRS